jgi:hypothetical protein
MRIGKYTTARVTQYGTGFQSSRFRVRVRVRFRACLFNCFPIDTSMDADLLFACVCARVRDHSFNRPRTFGTR